jgi:hypothetical protein
MSEPKTTPSFLERRARVMDEQKTPKGARSWHREARELVRSCSANGGFRH